MQDGGNVLLSRSLKLENRARRSGGGTEASLFTLTLCVFGSIHGFAHLFQATENKIRDARTRRFL